MMWRSGSRKDSSKPRPGQRRRRWSMWVPRRRRGSCKSFCSYSLQSWWGRSGLVGKLCFGTNRKERVSTGKIDFCGVGFR